MRVTLWPHSLFGRLLAASVIAVLLAQAVVLFLIAQERERFVLQGSAREWTRRIVETTLMLQPLSPAERSDAVGELSLPHEHHARLMRHAEMMRNAPPPDSAFVRLPLLTDFERTLGTQLHGALGPGYEVQVTPTPDPAPPAIAVPVPFFEAHELAAHQASAQRYDVSVRFADGDTVL
ncbi:MAG TPA: hypothetical protein VH109_12615, partial [Steroidobacteraceae bacterium]|nr:hypothetical protein [Steroidobacteraceae bacterium]